MLHWLQRQGHDAGILTTEDALALEAIANCWKLYALADRSGRLRALFAIAMLVGGIKESSRKNPKLLARELIGRAIEESGRDRAWFEFLRVAQQAAGWFGNFNRKETAVRS